MAASEYSQLLAIPRDAETEIDAETGISVILGEVNEMIDENDNSIPPLHTDLAPISAICPK